MIWNSEEWQMIIYIAVEARVIAWGGGGGGGELALNYGEGQIWRSEGITVENRENFWGGGAGGGGIVCWWEEKFQRGVELEDSSRKSLREGEGGGG